MRASFYTAILAAAIFTGKVIAGVDHAAIITAKEVADQAMFPGRPIFTPSWDLPTEPGNYSKTDTFNGTIQHAMKQMDEAHPGWLQKYNVWAEAQGKTLTVIEQRKRAVEECHNNDWVRNTRCGDGFTYGRWDASQGNAMYLHQVGGMSGMRAGPKACGRVSCQWDTAIFTCNDNNHYIETAWSAAGDAADCINDKCFLWGGDQFRVAGHAFHWRDNWNVIVRGLTRDSNDGPDDQHC